MLVTLILSFFTLVLGELVPKRVAMKKAEALSLSMAGIIGTLSTLFRPIVWLLSVSTNGVLRLFGIDPNAANDTVYEEDIKDLADQGSRKGEIDSDEREIIHNLFEFDDISVGEIATHRTDMVVLDTADSDADWHATARRPATAAIRSATRAATRSSAFSRRATTSRLPTMTVGAF